MSLLRPALGLSLALAAAGLRAQDFLDHVDDALTVGAAEGFFRARLSGTVDVEAYRLQQPSPGLLYTDENSLFNPRLTVFLDAQLGSHLYLFVQTRADRGYDPADERARVRLDEYALRFTPGDDGRINFQIGKFATAVGNWVPRHGSWDNPFVTAPLPYENLTGIWNLVAARSFPQLLNWAHVRPPQFFGDEYVDRRLRSPIVWGPSYASGAAVFGELGKFKYAVEVKNASLASHPDVWDDTGRENWAHPSFAGRLGYRPDARWDLGVSAGTGPYLRPEIESTLSPGRGLGDYRETVLGQDIRFAWHHLQIWAEFYTARFEIPKVGDVDTFSYYVEAKYKFTPQFFGAVRWNMQFFSEVDDGAGGRSPWGRDAWRIDLAPGYRFTPHTMVKLQYSLQHDDNSPRAYHGTTALQFVLRF